MLVEIVQQRVHRVARRARGIVVEDQPVARVRLDQFARVKWCWKSTIIAGVPYLISS